MSARAPELVATRAGVDGLTTALAAGGLTVTPAATPPGPLRRTWLDTFDWRLRRAGLELEQVETNGETSFELRGRGGHALTAPAAVPAAWPATSSALQAGPLRDRVTEAVGIRALIETARFDGSRRTWRVLDDEAKTIARLHIDTPNRAVDGDTAPARVTVHPLRGYDGEAGRAGSLLASLNGVEPAPSSCYEQCVAATGRRFDDALGGRPGAAITPDMPAAAAMAAVLRTFLSTVEANVPGVLADIDTEFLHDLRVAVRRARSTVKLAGDVLPSAAPAAGRWPLAHFAAELKWLGDATTLTRDLDVYLLGVPSMAERLRAARPDDLHAFYTHLAQRRAEAFARLAADLRSVRFAALLGCWRAVAAVDRDGVTAGQTAAELGADRLRRAHRKVVKLGSTISTFTPPERLHTLRKRCKELRYLLEIFERVEPPRARKRVLPVLKALQDCLGEFQDSEVQAGAIRAFAGEMMSAGTAPPATLLAMGELGAQLDSDQRHARETFAATFAAFTTATQSLHWAEGNGSS